MFQPARPSATRQELAAALAPFAVPDTRVGLHLFAIDLVVYAVGMALALFADGIGWRIFGAVIVGLKMGSLYTLAHDAVHNTLTASRRLNMWLGAIGYLCSLHNDRVRRYDHLVIGHHPGTNGPQPDVWRPMAWAEYREAPWWRRLWERFTRAPNVVGFAPYGFVSRWLKAEVLPNPAMSARHRREAWGYAALLAGYVGVIVGWLVVRNDGAALAVLGDVMLVLGVPFFIFQTLQAAILYFQHTHPLVPWFGPGDRRFDDWGPEALTVHVKVPAWLATLTHDICEHPAHHVLPAIPCYRLRAAQQRLAELIGPRSLEVPLAWGPLAEIMRRCKVYDYEQQRWLDFDGRPTAVSGIASAPLGAPA